MPIFHMLVGLPGSGKTYYANKYLKQENTTILSSDEIRKALLGSEDAQWGNSIVFDAMNHAAIENLRQGRHVIYDATNINSKRRMGLLDQIKKEINPSENDLMLMRYRLNKATPDELERTYEAFERFGVKIVMDLVRQ